MSRPFHAIGPNGGLSLVRRRRDRRRRRRPDLRNLLARAGLGVLLIEQHTVVGGYCSTFTRRGYTFDAASHFYPLLGNRSTITGRLLADLGVETEWVKMDPVDQFHLPDGSSFAVPADYDIYIAQLEARVSRRSGCDRRFFPSRPAPVPARGAGILRGDLHRPARGRPAPFGA